MSKARAILLILACLAAAALGYTVAGLPADKPTSMIENVTDFQSVNQEGTIEAQGSYVWREE